jgi:hypothetical protein
MVNDSVTFTAQLAGVAFTPVVPSGAVNFTANGSTISGCSAVTVNATGKATCTTSSLAAGSDPITGTYSGDSNFTVASAGTMTQTVTATTTTTAASASVNYSPSSQAVALSATVTSGSGTVNVGTVTFTVFNGDSAVGVAATSGTVTGGAASATYTLPGGTVVGAYSIHAVYNASAPFATSSDSTHSLTVGKATATVTLGSLSQTYTGSALAATATTTPSGLTVNFTYNGSSTAPTAAGSYTVVGTISDSNYQGSNTGTLVIGKAALTVAVNPASSVYGVAFPTFTGTLSGVLTGDGLTATYSTTATPTSPAGGTYTITATLVDPNSKLGNYTVTNTPATLTITKATPAITWATPAAITYGTVVSATQLNASSPVAGTFVYTPAAGTVLGAGPQTLSVTQNPNDTTDYNAATTTVQLTVNQATQTITFTAPTSPVTYGVSPITLVATGGASGNAIVFSVVSGPGTIGGSTLTVTGVGTVVVAANQAGNTNYSAATQVMQSIVVNVIGAAATPTFSPVAGTYTAAQTVTIGDATSGATIYYTTDGTAPTTSSTRYTAAIAVSSTETLQAIATATNYSTSAVATAAYTLVNPAPAISGISPAFTDAGGTVFTLTVNGSGFIATSTIYWGASALTTTYVSATQLTAQVPAADIATAGTIAITVQSPAPGGGTSNAWQFEVDSASSGSTASTITSTTETVVAGSTASYPVTVPTSVTSVSVTCLNLPTGASCSYSSTSKTVMIATSSTTPKGTYQITVVFTDTITSAAFLLPILLLPLGFMRRKLAARGIWLTACLGLVLMATAALSIGCGGGGSSTPPATQQVTNSGSVSLTIQ